MASPLRRAVALLSGGLDSTVALAMWLEAGHEVEVAWTFDYGQQAARMERRYAAAFAAARDVDWEPVPMPRLEEAAKLGASALVGGGDPMGLPDSGSDAEPGDARTAASVWVPARNLVMVSLAAARAEAVGADAVVVGFNAEEAATFPDNSTDFVSACNEAMRLGCRRPVEVCAPTVGWGKAEIVAAAKRSGISPRNLWSCYGPGPEPCGRCESCRRSRRAWGSPS